MKEQQIILEVDTLQNLVQWFGRNFVVGNRLSDVRALDMFANKIGTDSDCDGYTAFSKFETDEEVAEYLRAFSYAKFVIESELVHETTWTHNEGLKTMYKTVSQTWKITVTPTVNSMDDAFVAYCPRPYNPSAHKFNN